MTKQDQLARILKDEVLTLANNTVEHLLGSCPDQVEDIENLYTRNCPHCGEAITNLAYKATEQHEAEGHCYTCPACQNGFTDHVEGQQEVMQWFIVSEWLAEELAAKGEVVWAPHGVAYWGRTGCGYALNYEACLLEIVDDMAA